MFRLSVCALILISAILNVESKGELSILNAPKGLIFRDNHKLLVSKLTDIFATALGYTVEEGYDWPGFEVKNPFTATAKCLLIFYMPGVSGMEFSSKTTLPLSVDDSIMDVYSGISKIIKMRYSDVENVLQKVDLEKNVQELENPTQDDLPELTTLKRVISQMVTKRNKNGAPDVYWMSLNSIAEGLQDRNDLKELLALTLSALSEKVEKIYDGMALVVAVTEDGDQSEIRSKREADVKATISLDDLNLAEDYSEDFPVIFNIILWLSVTLLFSLFAISMVIGGMDPGRDSIIYRMTNTRMKKDN